MSSKSKGVLQNNTLFVGGTLFLLGTYILHKLAGWVFKPQIQRKRMERAAAFCETLLELEEQERASRNRPTNDNTATM